MAEFVLEVDISLRSAELQPYQGLTNIPWDALSPEIAIPKGPLSPGMVLICGLPQPKNTPFICLSVHMLPRIPGSKGVLSFGKPLFGSPL